MNWTQYIVPVASAITVVAIAIADIITHRRTSNKFDRIIAEELKLKDEQIKTLETNHQGMLAMKDELINNLKELSPPKIKEIFDSTKAMLEEQIDNQDSVIQGLQETIELLKSEKEEVANANEELQRRIPTFVLSDSEKIFFKEFITGSNMTVQIMGGTVDSLSSIENSLINNKEKMRNFTVITPEPAVAVTGGVDPKVQISEETKDEEDN